MNKFLTFILIGFLAIGFQAHAMQEQKVIESMEAFFESNCKNALETNIDNFAYLGNFFNCLNQLKASPYVRNENGKKVRSVDIRPLEVLIYNNLPKPIEPKRKIRTVRVGMTDLAIGIAAGIGLGCVIGWAGRSFWNS